MTPLFSILNFPSFDKIFETRKFEEKLHIVHCMLLLPACKNRGEIVKDGICTCPPGQIAMYGECIGMCYVFSQYFGFFLENW